MNKQTSASRFTAAERENMRRFWREYEEHYEAIQETLREEARSIPQFAPMMTQMSPEELEAQGEKSREMERAAIMEGEWGPYLAHLREQGKTYASAGVGFGTWFDLVTVVRRCFLDDFADDIDPDELVDVLAGMDRFLDLGMATIGEAYIATKQEVILSQQEEIREISTPVLQVRDQMLILPIVGMVDTHRARQLTEDLLHKIKDRRARVVVMDITAVPVVDSKVANHFVQTVDAAKLMGATVIITGVSPEIARTLVTIGASLGEVTTVGNLQAGIEAAERMLGLRVGQDDPTLSQAAE